MSRASKFHKLIEEQNPEEKKALWKRLESRIESECEFDNIESEGEVLVMSRSRTDTTRRNILIIVAAFMAVVLALCVTLFVVKPFNSNSAEDGDNKNEIEKPDDKRYCTVNDYSTEISKITIKQYAADNNLELLYFDYYEQSEYYADTQYVLSETQEVICLQEEMYDMNYAHINLYVTDDRTELDILKSFDIYYSSTMEIGSVKIDYSINATISYARFTYKKHVYNLIVSDAPEEGYILKLVETLLN